jgi:rhamnosyl/mannosyltransferase
MRILHIYKDYYPPIWGGVEITMNTLARGCRDAGHEVEILVANRRFRTVSETVEGIRVTKVADLGRLLSTPLAPTFPLWLRRRKADILHFHLPLPTSVISHQIIRPPGKVVAHYHSDIVRQKAFMRYYRASLYRFLERADAIIATSPHYLESSPALQAFKEKVTVIPLSVDPERLEGDGEVDRAAERLHLRYGERPVILFVGVLRYYKGVKYLIEAMKGVPANLLIVGNGPRFRELVRLRDSLDLRGNVFFMGSVPDVRPFYRAADIFCLPSVERSEAFGIVLLEAMASRLPLVTTDLHTGVTYVNRHGETGFAVPAREAGPLRNALLTLIADKELRERMGQAGYERRLAEFTREKMIQGVLDLYDRLSK